MKLPENEKTWIAGGIAGAVLLTAVAWFGAISPQRSSAADLHSQRADAETENTVLLVKTNRLRTDSKNLRQLSEQLADRLDKLPLDSDFSGLTVQLNRQAAASHVELTSIVIGTAAVANGAASGAAGSASAPSTPAGSIFAVPLTVVSSGSLASQKAFLSQLQQVGPRLALVTSTKLVPAAAENGKSIDPGSSMTTAFNAFVAPQSAEVAAQLAKQLAAGSSG